MRKINDRLEAFEFPKETIDEVTEIIEPTLEERLEAVEAALLEQLLRRLSDV